VPRVVTDSSCDLPKELLASRAITVVPLSVIIDDMTFHEDIEITPSEFYDRMARSSALPKTSQPSPAEFQEAFDTLADEGPVLCLTISSGLSGTYESARLARTLSRADAIVFDSLTGSLGLGLQVLMACDLVDANRAASDIIDELTRHRASMNTFVMLNTLDNIVKGGRLSRLQGSVSKLLDIRALLHDADGAVEVLEKVHGHRRLLDETVKQVAARRSDLSDRDVGITHFNNLEDAEWLATALRERLSARSVIVAEMGPTMATYAGEGGMILAF
jgi:DegV family protein with EDD domain